MKRGLRTSGDGHLYRRTGPKVQLDEWPGTHGGSGYLGAMLALQKRLAGAGQLGLEDVPTPLAGPGQALLEVAYAGICGTDLHIEDDEFPSEPPVTLGHELSGVIRDLGPGTNTALKIGDRVTSETYFYTCGQCLECRSGAPNMCLQRRSIGSKENGAFARFVVVPVRNLHRLPTNVSLQAGALTEPLACVVHNALEIAGVRAGEVCVVSGPGPIGLLTLQVAQAAGAKVVMLGTRADERRLRLAEQLGARAIDVTGGLDEARRTVMDLTPRGADVAFECAGVGASAAACLELLKPRGRYAQVGLYGKPISFPMDQACLKEITITGSNATVPSAWAWALRLLESGAVNTEAIVSDVVRLEEWHDAFARLRRKDAVKILLQPGDDLTVAAD